MSAILQFLSVDSTFFTIFNYPMSYVEFFGTILNIACVWLLVKKNILSWPVGIVAVLLFGALFYQLNLYADLFEQIYFLITGFWGWYVWAKFKEKRDAKEDIVVETNTKQQNLYWLAGIVVFTLIGSWMMSNIHIWLPKYFPEPASLPLLDVFTTIMSFVAQILLVMKRLENWVLWILVDIIGIGLYWYKGVLLVSLLYVVFLVLATNGLIVWRKTLTQQKEA